MRLSDIRYAVVFKTYTWDPFTERQARRCQAAAPSGDLFISLDVTQGDHANLPFERVVRISNGSLAAEGWPARVEHKSLLWWNPDLPHYQFHRLHPEYDFYIFVEYDAVFLGDWDVIVETLASEHVDFAAFPLRVPLAQWHWAQRHAATYTSEEVRGCLMCISVQSGKALHVLGERRLEMAREGVPYWPSAEVFLPTEVQRLGLKTLSLDRFAGASRFDWLPPVLENEMADVQGPAFLHPVYDRQRFLRWALAHTATLPQLLERTGPVQRHLARLPLRVYLLPFVALVCRALAASARLHARRWLRPRVGSSAPARSSQP